MPDYPARNRQTGKLLKERKLEGDRAHKLLATARDDLADTVLLCVASGVGFLISPTSDGGALSITVYAGEKRERDYAGNPDDLAQLLEAVRDFAQAALYEGTK
jgi:hypothetical protein